MPTPPFNATVQLKLPGIAPDDLIGVWDNVTNYDTSVDPMVFDNEEGTIREWPKSEYILVIRDSLGAIVENSGDNTDPASSVEVPENVVDEVNRVAANLKDTGSVNKSLREDDSYQDVPSVVQLLAEDYDIDASLRSTSNNGGFDPCHTYITKVLPQGNYNIRIPITCRSSTTFQDITYRIAVDTGGGLTPVNEIMVEEMKDSSLNQRYKRSLSARVSLPAVGTMTVQLEFGVVGTITTNQCYESEIYVAESNA